MTLVFCYDARMLQNRQPVVGCRIGSLFICKICVLQCPWCIAAVFMPLGIIGILTMESNLFRKKNGIRHCWGLEIFNVLLGIPSILGMNAAKMGSTHSMIQNIHQGWTMLQIAPLLSNPIRPGD